VEEVVAESLAEPIGNWCGGDGVERGGAHDGAMAVRLPCWWEGESKGDGMEGERGRPSLHSELARDVESPSRACTPRGGRSLRAVGHKAHGRCLNLTPDSVISRQTTRFQQFITRNPARVSIRCQQQNCRAM
jgi:hypothetical protein